MVKPQFELGRERVGKGGVVRVADDRREALARLVAAPRPPAWTRLRGFGAPPALPGPKGNRETFIWCAPSGDPRSTSTSAR